MFGYLNSIGSAVRLVAIVHYTNLSYSECAFIIADKV